MKPTTDTGSFRDPAGYVFRQHGKTYRQVNSVYSQTYDLLMNSGLYEELTAAGLLLAHEEVAAFHAEQKSDAYRVLLPEQLEIITYPYEWSPRMLKDAALLTLEINLRAIRYGLILKDASAFNVQFVKGKPVFIDTLSFERYDADEPWIAYRQFCQHFLFPMFILRYAKINCCSWVRIHIDGIPLELCSRILPWRSKWSLSVFLHVVLQHWLSKPGKPATHSAKFSFQKMQRLLNGLHATISALQTPQKSGQWTTYYNESIHGGAYLQEKTDAILNWVKQGQPRSLLDLGCNTGQISLAIAAMNIPVTAVDFDYAAVDRLQAEIQERNLPITAMVTNLLNPAAAVGWAHEERLSFSERVRSEGVLCLALIHHLYFTGGISLTLILKWMRTLCTAWCIVEFVDPVDEKITIISQGKQALLPGYTLHLFETACSEYFTIESKAMLNDWQRTLYLLKPLADA